MKSHPKLTIDYQSSPDEYVVFGGGGLALVESAEVDCGGGDLQRPEGLLPVLRDAVAQVHAALQTSQGLRLVTVDPLVHLSGHAAEVVEEFKRGRRQDRNRWRVLG